MARRPDVFDQPAFQESLRRQGCPESFIAPTTSSFRRFVPLILHDLGEDRIFALVEQARPAVGLGDAHAAWCPIATYIAGWADEQIAAYKAGKTTSGETREDG